MYELIHLYTPKKPAKYVHKESKFYACLECMTAHETRHCNGTCTPSWTLCPNHQEAHDTKTIHIDFEMLTYLRTQVYTEKIPRPPTLASHAARTGKTRNIFTLWPRKTTSNDHARGCLFGAGAADTKIRVSGHSFMKGDLLALQDKVAETLLDARYSMRERLGSTTAMTTIAEHVFFKRCHGVYMNAFGEEWGDAEGQVVGGGPDKSTEEGGVTLSMVESRLLLIRTGQVSRLSLPIVMWAFQHRYQDQDGWLAEDNAVLEVEAGTK